jgi:hypothetical protein
MHFGMKSYLKSTRNHTAKHGKLFEFDEVNYNSNFFFFEKPD